MVVFILMMVSLISHRDLLRRIGGCPVRVGSLAHFNFVPVGFRHYHFEYARFEAGSHTFGVDAMRKVKRALLQSLSPRVSHCKPPFTNLDFERLRIGVGHGDLDSVTFSVFGD